MSKIVVIGAGISGLALAFRLQERDPQAEIVLLESASRPGGTIWTLREEGYCVEMGPNGFLDSKPSTLQLCHDLGLDSRLLPASAAAREHRYLYLEGRLRPLPGGLAAFLASDLLSWRGKLGLLLERFRRPASFADESIDAFARRRAGPEVAEVFADAMVTGIYAGDPQQLSLPACFPRLAHMERLHGSVIRGFFHEAKQRRAEAKARGEPIRRPGQMWSFREGLRTLIETLVSRLKSPPRFNVSVQSIGKDENGWLIRTENGETLQADSVVLTCPAYRQADILSQHDPGLAKEIAGIPYNRIAVVALVFPRAAIPGSIEGFGFIAPQRSARDLLGVQWCSSIYAGRAPDGQVLMRALLGGWKRPEIVDWDDAHLVKAVQAELKIAMGITAPPNFHRIIRWNRAIPQYHLGHLDRLRRVEAHLTRHPGLYLAGNAYRGVSLNDCTEQATLLAEQIFRSIDSKPN